jgi:hypothetical protein
MLLMGGSLVSEGIIARGARGGPFVVDADDPASLTIAALSCSSTRYGVTTHQMQTSLGELLGEDRAQT